MRLQQKQIPCTRFLCSSLFPPVLNTEGLVTRGFLSGSKEVLSARTAIYACKVALSYCRKSTAAFSVHKSDRLAALSRNQMQFCCINPLPHTFVSAIQSPFEILLYLFSPHQWLLGHLACLCEQISDRDRYWDVPKLSCMLFTRSKNSLSSSAQEKAQDELQPASKTLLFPSTCQVGITTPPLMLPLTS